jgi:AraC-like DNA-binding protein
MPGYPVSNVHEFFYSGSLQNSPALNQELAGFTTRTVHVSRMEGLTLAPNARVKIHLRTRMIDGFGLLCGRSAGQGIRGGREIRDAAAIASDGRDQFALVLSLSGGSVLSQFGRTQHIEPGSYGLVRTAEPFIHEVQDADTSGESVTFYMPAKFVDQRLVVGERFCVRPPDRTRGLHDLLFGTVDLFRRNAWRLSADDFHSAARAVADLVLVALDGSTDGVSDEGSVRDANLIRAKHIIHKRLSQADLTLKDIAHEAGLSLNYLHRLFRRENCTVYEYLKRQRLQRARELLEMSANRGKRAITDVSLDCGFSDPSYFSRSFKQTFGISPRDVGQHRGRA